MGLLIDTSANVILALFRVQDFLELAAEALAFPFRAGIVQRRTPVQLRVLTLAILEALASSILSIFAFEALLFGLIFPLDFQPLILNRKVRAANLFITCSLLRERRAGFAVVFCRSRDRSGPRLLAAPALLGALAPFTEIANRAVDWAGLRVAASRFRQGRATLTS